MQKLIPAYIQQQLTAGRLNGTLQAFTLNIDLSGFTQLMDDLMRQGSQGAESMSVILNEIFEPLVALVYRRGGIIPYFAGDAFTAVFPLPADQMHAMHLLQTAAEAREIFRQRDNQFGGQYTIGIKAGIAQGKVEFGIVGNRTKAFYFRGPAIDAAANCQSLANDQDILIDDLTNNLINGRPITTEELAPDAYLIVGKITGETAIVSPLELPEIDPEIAEQFLPPTVVRNEQVGEFRTVITAFLAFNNVDSHEQMVSFAGAVLDQACNFGAYFKEIDFGDKGGFMSIFFGAPVSYENSVVRALEFSLAIRQDIEKIRSQYPDIQFRMGLSMGTAFTGIVGGKERCQYACVGNRVNLAARIMSYADWQEILIDDAVAHGHLFRFHPKGKTKYKGISEPIPTFALTGRLQNEGKPGYSGPMIARTEECEQLKDFISPIFEGKPAGIGYVYGEAGIGKSRTTHELRRQLSKQYKLSWQLCPCDQILRKPFNPYIYFLRHYFQQSLEATAAHNSSRFEKQLEIIKSQLAENDHPAATDCLRELERTRPVLAALLGLPYPKSLWEQLDAQGRYQNTISAIVNLLLSESLITPLIIELEDIHWIDEDSHKLSRELLRQINGFPIFLLCTARLYDDGSHPIILSPEAEAELQLSSIGIELSGLSSVDVRTFAERSLAGPIHPEFLEVLLKASNSNPFYVEQLLEYFRENNLIIRDDGAWNLRDKNIKLSNSINSILTARIDRLSDMVRETVKAAAVIGREFDIPVLTEVLRTESGFVDSDADTHQLLTEQIKLAEQGQIWSAMNELRYIFRHSLMREAAYSMQLNTRLQQLHAQIAGAIERIYRDNIEERYVDLAFHYEQAGNDEQTIEYLRKAADYTRANFQNQQALDFYDRLIAKSGVHNDPAEILKTYLNKGKVLEMIGRWEEAQQAYEQAQRLAKKSRDIILLGRANNYLGQLLMLRGRYDEAMQFLQIAAGLFESIDDPLGIAKVYGNLGNLFFRRANYDKAEEYYRKSLDTGFSEMGTASSAQTVSFLGLTYMNRGQYEEGIKLIRDQIPLHESNNDVIGLAGLHINLGIVYFESGDYAAAKEEYERGLKLADTLGNKQLQAIGTGCLGTVLEKQGHYDEAETLFIRDLKLCKELGDWQGIAIAEGLMGELYSVMGDFERAFPHLDQSLRISKELGYQKGIAKAINALGDLYYWREDYQKSLDFYDQAIEIARKTENRLVLCSSLMEKGLVLLKTDQNDALKATEIEATAIAQELGNPELLVGTKILSARNLAKQNAFSDAIECIQDLIEQHDLSPEQMAGAYYERFLISRKDAEARDLARALYEQLYIETPKHTYKIRLEKLRAETEG